MPDYSTREEIEALSTADPDWTAYLASSAEKSPLIQMPFPDVVAFWKSNPQIPDLPNTSTEFTITAELRDRHQSSIRVYKPVPTLVSGGSGTKTGLVVLVHGGGFCLGHWSHVQTYAKSIAYLHGVTVASVSYRLAPEHKFPTAHEDVWDSLKYLTSSAGLEALGGDVDPHKGLVVGGVSAGANITAVTVQNSVLGDGMEMEGGVQVSGMWLSIPALHSEGTVPDKYKELWISREQNKDAKIISKADVEYTEGTYGAVYESDMFCPGFGHGEKAHRGMPRTLIQVAGQDPLRDDGLIYGKVLKDHGVDTRVEVYKGVPHGFADLLKIPAAEKANRDMLKGMGWLLGKTEPSDEQCNVALEAAAA